MLSGCKSYEAIAQFGRDKGPALAHVLGFRRGKTPCKSTFSVLFRALDIDAFEAILSGWITTRLPASPELVASLDGKNLRGSRDGEAPGQHLVAVYAPHVQAVLAQIRVDSKTNEHKAALQLLGILPLAGRIFLGDAMFCQRDVCAKIIAGGGDYIFFVKDNQPSLAIDIDAGLAYETAARATAAAFSPCGSAGHTGGACGLGAGQGARSPGETHPPNDQHLDQTAGLGGSAARLCVDSGANGEGGHERGGGPRDHQPGCRAGGRHAFRGTDAWALGDRERSAL
jgi:hypothetical protein